MFLDIAWIKNIASRIPNLDAKWALKGSAEEHIKKKLPSMYHQFMQLANIDITARYRMEVGPDDALHRWVAYASTAIRR